MRYLPWDNYVRLVLSYAVFQRNQDDTWTVEVPILPGCVTWGETREEAAEMVEDAVKGWTLTALRFGDEIPVIDGCTLGYAIDVDLTLKVAHAQAET
jgi:antitoxin HicB